MGKYSPEPLVSLWRMPDLGFEFLDHTSAHALYAAPVQELVSRRGRRGWRSLVAALAVAALVLALVVAGAVLLASGGDSSTAQAQQGPAEQGVPLEDVLGGRLSAAPANASWISDSELLYKDPLGQIIIFDVAKQKKTELLGENFAVQYPTLQLELSEDQKYLLISSNHSKLFRHTYLAQYEIINIEKKTKMPLVNSEGLLDNKVLQLVVWAPTGNALVYVYHNNIYYRPTAELAREFKLTTTGSFGSIYHGTPDWVYEEEVLASNKALWFSPDGKKLAYATFNDSLTRVMTIPYYGSPANLEFQYTRAVNVRYPKPGTPNPTVSLTVVQLEGFSAFDIPPPKELANSEPILTAVSWANSNEVSAVWMNRVQNEAAIVVCSTVDFSCKNILEIKEPKGWIDLFVPPKFSDNGDKMIIILPQEEDEKNGAFRHITLVDRNFVPPKMTALTTGKFVVTEILAWDTTTRTIFYLANQEEDPGVSHLYSVSDSTESKELPKCLSCNAKTRDGNELCLYNKAAFSKKNSYYMLNCAGPDIPEASIYSKDNKKVMVWESNEEIRKLLQHKSLPSVRHLQVEVPGGFKAQVQMWLPPNMDRKQKYPLLINVYGGPDSFQVTKRFSIDWSTYLTVNRSIIYAAIDGRGSGLKGNKMLFAGYRRLGTVEIEDQLSVTKYIQDNFDFVDKNRTGIWGWSYGGYSTGMALATDRESVFKCGIAVAPVTDWAYYDTIYTERYMGLPTVDDNLEGYVASQLINKVDNFRNKMFFLVHGTLDDNVHYQQSMMLSKALEHKDILFRQQSYPDEEHGLSGVRPHLYHTLEDFLEECFNLK
ncbi:venom dipeptidyl peptidase 4-like isoform X1 [Schistocerca cancellata]|uniref:venom dipeptidyl peptidase 4-like isoform X1 n=1 Tax=Schistocerca cancellata TaxID=274614 RepID=UPI0021191D93|nr:venom dipeptidyl peptidase 4-like isoform X1 [Schistocerca cancellata]